MDKCWIKNWIECAKYGLIENSVTHTGFVYVPKFRIANIKSDISVRLPTSRDEFLVEFKCIFFEIELECLHILVFCLTLLEFAPRGK